ncbi:hypothetical protein M3Y99_01881600 [Aphelenchoides fujianensis]|nr:hypothetical protein M3Y99_01881600 [Aphelenchoides fujianensis]
MPGQEKTDHKPSIQPEEIEDDDEGSSDFSIISHEDLETVSGGLSSLHGEVAVSETLETRSINPQFVFAVSSMLNSAVNKEVPMEFERPASWQPDALSGRRSSEFVTEMFHKVSRQYEEGRKMLLDINSLLSRLNVSEHGDQVSKGEPLVNEVANQLATDQDELTATKLAMQQLKLELAKKEDEAKAANLKAAALVSEKRELLREMKKLEDGNAHIQQLEKFLQGQCECGRNLCKQPAKHGLAARTAEILDHIRARLLLSFFDETPQDVKRSLEYLHAIVAGGQPSVEEPPKGPRNPEDEPCPQHEHFPEACSHLFFRRIDAMDILSRSNCGNAILEHLRSLAKSDGRLELDRTIRSKLTNILGHYLLIHADSTGSPTAVERRLMVSTFLAQLPHAIHPDVFSNSSGTGCLDSWLRNKRRTGLRQKGLFTTRGSTV